MKKLRVLSLVVVLLASLSTAACAGTASLMEKPDLAVNFEGMSGTFILYDEAKGSYTVYNEQGSRERLSPCSTFKIYNSLAALETGVLDREDVFTLAKWDGTHYAIPSWNQDQTLASATRDSVVWYFQGVASRIGNSRMQAFLDRIGYGNRDISGGITTFWLRSSLTISAREQVDMLQRLFSGQLGVSPQNIEVVRKNITLSEENGIRFMGKTGSGYQDGHYILGWFVGSVEKEGRRYFFATNIRADEGATGGKARDITITILKQLNIL